MLKKIPFFIIISPLILAPLLVKSQDLGDPNCDSLLLVSSWQSDNVKIYDGCHNNDYIRDLDSDGLLDGPQAIFIDQNDDVVIVSEQNHRFVRFDRQTLSQGTVVSGDDPGTDQIEPRLLNNPLAVVTDSAGHLLVGGYSNNNIVKVSADNYQIVQTVLTASTQHLRGLDIGMAIGPDGQLYVPGFDSDNIIKVNLDTLAVSEVVANGVGGLNAPRAILFHQNFMYVTAWRTGAVLRYDLNGIFVDRFATIRSPTGIISDGNGFALVASDRPQVNKVVRLNLSNGNQEDVIAPGATGNLNGATYVFRLPKKAPQSVKMARHHWMVGVGEIADNTVVVDNFSTTRGGAFGNDFDTDAIDVSDWGRLNLEFVGCNQAMMSYESFIQDDGLVFGDGGYDVFRLASNAAVKSCLEQGFDQVEDKSWMSGTLFGGPNRSGEGFLLDVLDDQRVIVTWYTYLPALSK